MTLKLINVFVLPLNDNGLPLVDSFLAVSFNAMEDMFRSADKASMPMIIWHSRCA